MTDTRLSDALAIMDKELKTALEMQGVSDQSHIAQLQLLFRIEAIAKGIVAFLDAQPQWSKKDIYIFIRQQALETAEVFEKEVTASLEQLFKAGASGGT